MDSLIFSKPCRVFIRQTVTTESVITRKCHFENQRTQTTKPQTPNPKTPTPKPQTLFSKWTFSKCPYTVLSLRDTVTLGGVSISQSRTLTILLQQDISYFSRTCLTFMGIYSEKSDPPLFTPETICGRNLSQIYRQYLTFLRFFIL